MNYRLKVKTQNLESNNNAKISSEFYSVYITE